MEKDDITKARIETALPMLNECYAIIYLSAESPLLVNASFISKYKM